MKEYQCQTELKSNMISTKLKLTESPINEMPSSYSHQNKIVSAQD